MTDESSFDCKVGVRAGELRTPTTIAGFIATVPASPVWSRGWLLLSPIVIFSSKTHMPCRAEGLQPPLVLVTAPAELASLVSFL